MTGADEVWTLTDGRLRDSMASICMIHARRVSDSLFETDAFMVDSVALQLFGALLSDDVPRGASSEDRRSLTSSSSSDASAVSVSNCVSEADAEPSVRIFWASPLAC